MKNVYKYMAFVVAVVMTLMMVSCGADKGTDVAQNTKSTATNSKYTSSVVSSTVVSSIVTSSEEASSVAASSEASSVEVSSEATSSKATSSGAWSSGKVTHGDSAGDVVMSPTYESSSRTVSSWVCPEPGTHDGVDCYSQLSHDSYVRQTKELAEYVPPVYPEGYDVNTWCTVCNRPKGDGYNGTCYRFLCHQGVNGSSCHHYDEDDGTCKEKHWGYAEKFGHE